MKLLRENFPHHKKKEDIKRTISMMYSTKTFDCQFPINGKKLKQNENIESFLFELVSLATKRKQANNLV